MIKVQFSIPELSSKNVTFIYLKIAVRTWKASVCQREKKSDFPRVREMVLPEELVMMKRKVLLTFTVAHLVGAKEPLSHNLR